MCCKMMFPRIFCIEDFQCTATDTDRHDYRVTLYHDQACITVSFNCAERDPDLTIGKLVKVRWKPVMRSAQGAIQIDGLTLLKDSMPDFDPNNFNLFRTVPHSSCIDRHLINCARDLWDISSHEMRQRLLDTVLGQATNSLKLPAGQA